MSATITTLDHTKDRSKQVQDALRALEKQDADRLAAQMAERRRLQLEVEAAEKKRKAASAAEREKRRREMQAEELRQQQEALRGAKQAESAALRAATESFKKEKQAQNDAKEKEDIMTALNNTSQQVLSGVLECQHLTSKLFGTLMLCEKRQRLREGRPQTEFFNDPVDQALEREWQMLTTSREELHVLATRGETFRSEMEMLRLQLRTGQSREKAMKSRLLKTNSMPVLTTGGQTQALAEKDVMKRALALMDEAAELPQRSAAAILKASSECDMATAEVHTSLDRRKAEVGELIKGLQDQKADAESTIGTAEKRISRLKRRAQNTMETPRSSKATENQLSSLEWLVVDLKSLKRSLEGDLRNKCHALKIDEHCRQLTKLKAGGKESARGQSEMRQTQVGFMRKTARDGAFGKTAKDGSFGRTAGDGSFGKSAREGSFGSFSQIPAAAA